MGHRDPATWSLEKASSHRKPKTEGLLPVTPPELEMLTFQLEIKDTVFLRPRNARIVAAGNSTISGTSQTRAYNRYPDWLKACVSQARRSVTFVRGP